MADGSVIIDIQANAHSASSSIAALTASLKELKGAQAGGFNNIKTLATNIEKLNGAFNSLKSNSASIRALTIGLGQLNQAMNSSSAGARTAKAGYKSMADETKKTTKSQKDLEKAVKATNSAMARSSNNKNAGITSGNPMKMSLNDKVGWGMVMTGASKAMSYMGLAVEEANNYIESMNLSQAIMGNQFGASSEFWQKAQDVMGIDSGEAMRYQGVFQSITSGFGVSTDKANEMAQAMTQLGYDISSFFNMDIEQAMLKIQSGIAGELEPLRRIGYDLSDARIAQDAYKLGIEGSTASMTQAEKAMVRYYEIMTQLTESHGDMARTLNSPANQIRILNSQLTILARNVGVLVLPALTTIVPALTAIIKLAQDAVSALSILLTGKGIDFGGYGADLSSVQSASAGAASNLEDAAGATGKGAKAAKEWRKQLMGFDEINNIAPQEESSGGSGGGGGGGGAGGGGNFDVAPYDFFAGLANSKVSEYLDGLKSIGDKMGIILPVAGVLIGKFKELEGFFRNGAKFMGQYAGKLLAMSKNMGEAGGFAGKLSKPLEKAFEVVKGLGSAFKGLGKYIGEVAEGPLGKFFKVLGPIAIVVGTVLDLKDAFEGFASIFEAIGSKTEVAEGDINKFVTALGGITLTLTMIGGPIGFLIGAVGSLAAAFALGVTAILSNWNSVTEAFSTGWQGMMDNAGKFGTWLGGWASGVMGDLGSTVDAGLHYLGFVQDAYADDTEGTNKQMTRTLSGDIKNFLSDTGQKWQTGWSDMATKFDQFKTSVGEIARKMKEAVVSWFTSMRDQASERIKGIWDSFVRWLSSPGNVLSGFVNSAVGFFSNLYNQAAGFFQNIWNSFAYWLSNPGSVARNFVNGIISMLNSGLRFIFQSINIGGVSISDFTGTPQIPYLAMGGLVGEGQMFIAREAGPELVGSYGSKSAVMNNDQIVESVSHGVAVANAQQNALLAEQNSLLRQILAKESGVYLDGASIAKSITRAQRQAGRPLVTM